MERKVHRREMDKETGSWQKQWMGEKLMVEAVLETQTGRSNLLEAGRKGGALVR